MKKLFLKLMFLCLIFSCDKQNEIEQEINNESSRLGEVVFPEGNTTMYLSKITEVGETPKYSLSMSYNENYSISSIKEIFVGNLKTDNGVVNNVKIIQECKKITYSDNNSITNFELHLDDIRYRTVSLEFEAKKVTEYSHYQVGNYIQNEILLDDENQPIEQLFYDLDVQYNEEEDKEIYTFFVNSSRTYEWSNGNIVSIKEFNWDKDENKTLVRTTTLSYDDKINPLGFYKNLSLLVHLNDSDEFLASRNNLIESHVDGIDTLGENFSFSYTFKYEYNEDGYPIKRQNEEGEVLTFEYIEQ